MKPAMSDPEIALLTSVLASTVDYVEFGSGGSTVVASSAVARSIISIDSSDEWLQRTAAACSGIVPTTLKIDLGPIGALGYPADQSRQADWPQYHSLVWKKNPAAKVADTVLVDGRFRVACFIQVLLNSVTNPIILVHDYERKNYHVIEEFAERLVLVDRLAIFRKKTSLDLESATRCLEQHCFEPS